MTRRILALAVLVAAGAVAAGPGSAAGGKLTGVVGPGFTIQVKMAGKTVKTLKAGTYTLTVSDKSTIHDFHLIGPGVNKVVTSVPFMGTKTVTVKLKKGTYTYQCDPHAAAGMMGTFVVK